MVSEIGRMLSKVLALISGGFLSVAKDVKDRLHLDYAFANSVG